MINLGERIRVARTAHGLKQFELARRAEIAPAQLCQIENGRTNPSFYMVERIAAALDSTIPELLYDACPKPSEKSNVSKTASTGEPSESSRFLPIRSVFERDGSKALRAIEREFAEPTVASPVASVCTLVWNRGRNHCNGAGAALAEDLRIELGLGTAPVGDLKSALRFRGVPIVETRLTKSVGSLSYWDVERQAPVVVLDSGTTPERRIYRLVYELGSAVLYASLGVRLDESLDQHRFLTDFTAAFLMPGPMVRTCVAASGIAPGAWTIDNVVPLKSYFGVSAESFILRLDELGLIQPKLRLALRNKLRAHYRKHPGSMEPVSASRREMTDV